MFGWSGREKLESLKSQLNESSKRVDTLLKYSIMTRYHELNGYKAESHNPFFLLKNIIYSLGKDLTLYSLQANLQYVSHQTDELKEIVLPSSLSLMSDEDKLLQVVVLCKSKLRKETLRVKLEKIQQELQSFLTFLRREFLPGLQTAIAEGNSRKRLNILIEVFKRLLFHFNQLQKSFKRLNTLLDICDALEKEVMKESIFLSQLCNNIDMQIKLTSPNYTFEGRMMLLHKRVEETNNLMRRMDVLLARIHEVFSTDYIQQPKNNWLRPEEYYHASVWNRALEEWKKEQEFLVEFKRAFDADNQQAMGEILRKHKHPQLIGVGSNLIAYAGVTPDQQYNGTWAGAGNIQLSPENYALRLKDIMENGYRSSNRELHMLEIGKVTAIKNVYFFDRQHLFYGGVHGLVSWDCKDYCVLRGHAGNPRFPEYIIITPQKIPPNKLTLLIARPGSLHDYPKEKDYQRQLIDNLERYKVRYALSDYPAEMH